MSEIEITRKHQNDSAEDVESETKGCLESGSQTTQKKRQRSTSEENLDDIVGKKPRLDNKHSQETEEEDDEDDDDGIALVMRDVNDLEQALKEENNSDYVGDDETREFPDEDYNDGIKMKFSGQKPSLKIDGVPMVSEAKYKQFISELGKRNCPFDVDLDSMTDKPWARNSVYFNSSLDDYFNFGFNEQTWKEYAARQVALRIHRMESGSNPGIAKFDEEENT